MRRYPRRGGQFGYIPVELLYEDSVPATAKLLYAEIYRLSDADGWCDASNRDFMELLGCSESTIHNLLRALVLVEQIRIETEPNRAGTGGKSRRIFCGRRLAPKGGAEVPAENCGYPSENEGGNSRNLQGVPAEICGDTYKSNIKNNPPLPPTGGRRRKKEPRANPDWKPERFEGLWKFYPAKGRKSKQDAMDAWDALKPDDALIDTMAKALRKLKATEEWQRNVGVPYVATFLRGQRWLDAEEEDAPEEAPRARRYIGTEIVNGEERDIYA